MEFDVIIGNPPYQMSVGNEGANSAYALAIYHLFIDKAIELSPKYVSMIIPSRWMTGSAEGVPKQWINKMIDSSNFRTIHDFAYAENLFNNVSIRAGVHYFLWDREYNGKCDFFHNPDSNASGEALKWRNHLNVFSPNSIVRNPNFHSIINKVENKHKNYYKNELENFSHLVGPSHFFDKNGILGSNWRGYSKKNDNWHNIKYYMSQRNKVPFGWINRSQVPKNTQAIDIHKVYIPAAGDPSEFGTVLGSPRYGEPNSVCSQSYLVIGYDYKRHNLTKEECQNIMSYVRTKFFRFMVKIKKTTQNAYQSVYEFVPLQDFSKPWTDEELYKKYKLTQEEITYIEDNIAPMSTSAD